MTNAPHHSPQDTTRLLTYEKSGEWANCLRSHLSDGGRWLLETRGLTQLADELNKYPTSLVLVETTRDNVVRLADRIAHWKRLHPRAIWAAGWVTSKRNALSLSDWGWTLRELGVAVVASSSSDSDEIGRLWSRQCHCYPPYETTVRDRIFARLPWSD